ncbi:MAG TPA: SprT family zinc-dependent metalloprotease [Candidatus Limnocylindria bacterium]|nr:SprT family zinc-dependent metalloprotease [Candidatus Limnocylindria bacterium]
MSVKKVTVPGLGDVNLHKRRGVRSLRLSIEHDGTVRVSMPYWLPYAAGAEFARSRRDWIKSKQIVAVPLRHGGKIGKAHRMVFIPEAGRTTLATRITSSGEVRVFHPAHLSNSEPAVQKAAERASIRALKQQGEKLLPQRLRALAQHHGFEYGKISIKQLKSRWGSCSSEKDIALNCFLMQLPWHLIDYVLLHELMHTQIMAHGTPFWDELSNYVPNLKAIRKEIKSYRPVLLTND